MEKIVAAANNNKEAITSGSLRVFSSIWA